MLWPQPQTVCSAGPAALNVWLPFVSFAERNALPERGFQWHITTKGLGPDCSVYTSLLESNTFEIFMLLFLELLSC